VEFGGRQIAQGDWIGLFYQSGNRDEAAFENPWQFDVLRDPNPHVGFGGGGPHSPGHHAGPRQLRSIWGELLTRVPEFEVGSRITCRQLHVRGQAAAVRLNLVELMRVFDDLDAFAAAAGENLGTSEWLTVDQEQINTFAEATGDRQWIHIDPARAADGPSRRPSRTGC